MSLNLKIVVGSTREGRNADQIIPLVESTARSFPEFNVEVLDLRDWPLPFFQETRETVGDFSDPTYSDPIVKAWNATIKDGDVFVFITPEYNYSIPGVLKNAIDSVFVSQGFRNKAMLPVGYSVGATGGGRAVLSLMPIALEIELHVIRNAVLIGNVGSAFENGEPTSPGTKAALEVGLEDLAWWGTALKNAREAGQLMPGGARMSQKLQPVAR